MRRVAPFVVFWFLAAAYFWRPLTTDRLLIPTSPTTWLPWKAEAQNDPSDSTATRSNALMGDSIILTVPWRIANSKALRDGRIPFWNPEIFCGYPHLAALQSNSLYPPVALLDLWDPLRGIAWSMAFHFGLAGSLMFSFLRRRGLGVHAALVGGVAFELNGFFMVRMSAPSYVFSGVWIPLLLEGIHDIGFGKTWRSSWKAVVAVAMGFLGGHPQIVAYMLLIAGAYALFLMWESNRGRRGIFTTGWTRIVATASAAVGLGLAMVGFQLLPFAELVAESSRTTVDWASFKRTAVPLPGLLQAIIPDLFGHPIDGDYWFNSAAAELNSNAPGNQIWGFNYCGENLFTGIAPLVLLAFGLFRGRSTERWFFAAVAGIALAVLLGSPIMRLYYLAVPILRGSRPDRIIYLVMTCISILAAHGWAATTEPRRSPIRINRRLILAISTIIAASLGYLMFFGNATTYSGRERFVETLLVNSMESRSRLIFQAVSATAIAALVLGCARWSRRNSPTARMYATASVIGLVSIPMFGFGWKFNPTQPTPLLPHSAAIDAVEHATAPFGRVVRVDGWRVLPANTSQVFGLFDVNGSSAAGIGRYLKLMSAADPAAVAKDKYFKGFDSRSLGNNWILLDRLSVRAVLSTRRLPLNDPPTVVSGISVYARSTAYPRFFIADRVSTYSDESDAREKLVRGQPDGSDRRVFVRSDSPAAVLSTESPYATPTRGHVSIATFEPERIILDVATSAPGLLASSEVQYPGWSVELDGSPVPIILVDTAFRGVLVPRGSHRVEMKYIPWSFYIGGALSIAAIGIWIALLTTGRPLPFGEFNEPSGS